MSNKYPHGSEFNINRYAYGKLWKNSEYFLENNPPKVKIPKNGT